MERRSWKHLSLEQRKVIEHRLREGVSVSKIANELGVHRNTIYNEIERGSRDGVYCAETGQSHYQETLSQKGRIPIIKGNKRLQQFIRGKILTEKKSPQQIEEELQEMQAPNLGYVGRQTIYSAIRLGYIPEVTMETLRGNFATIQKDGSLYIPKWAIEKYELKHGQQFEISIENDTIVLKPLIESEDHLT